MHPAVAALSLDEKGFVLGAALARMPPADVEARLTGASGARCAAAVAALAAGSRAERATEIAALTAVIRAPVPAGVERIHPGWLHERFAREATEAVLAAAAGLPSEARAVASDVLRARGERAPGTPLPNSLPASRGEGTRGPLLASRGEGTRSSAVQRVMFAGLVPLAGPGGPATPLARELAALAPDDLMRAIERRGAETLGRSLRGAPAAVIARAAAALGAPLGAALLEAARADAGADEAARERARRRVAAAGVAASGEVARGVGIQAVADALAEEGAGALQAIAQCLPPELGRHLLAAADGNG